jgi:hypothetical protein
MGDSSWVKGPPYLHMIELLGELAANDDSALETLILAFRQSDGWVAESIFSMIEEAKETRMKKDVLELIRKKEH